MEVLSDVEPSFLASYVLPPPQTAFRATLSDLRKLTRDVTRDVARNNSTVSSHRADYSYAVDSFQHARHTFRSQPLYQERSVRRKQNAVGTSQTYPEFFPHALPNISENRKPAHRDSGAMTQRHRRSPWPALREAERLGLRLSAREIPSESHIGPSYHTVFPVVYGAQRNLDASSSLFLPAIRRSEEHEAPRKRATNQRFLKPMSLDGQITEIANTLLGSANSRFYWRSTDTDTDYSGLRSGVYFNHFQKHKELTTKVGLANNLMRFAAVGGNTAEHFFPACYDLSREAGRAGFVLHFRRLMALMLVRRHLRLEASRTSHVSAQDYSCNLDVIFAAQSGIQEWCHELDPNSRQNVCAPSDGMWDLILFYNELADNHLCDKAAVDRALRPNQLAESAAHQWGNVPPNLRALLEKLLARVEELFPQWSLQCEPPVHNIWRVKVGGASAKDPHVDCSNVLRELLLRCDSSEECIVQKYIEKPLLLFGGRKFDIHQWVLVRSVSPLKVFLFSECHVSICGDPFEVDDLRAQSQHIASSKTSRRVTRDPMSVNMAGGGSIASLAQLRAELHEVSERRSIWEEELEPQIRNIVMHVLRSVEHALVPRGESFELCSFDFVVDESMRLWLLGVHPCSDHFQANAPFLDTLLRRMAKRLVELVVCGRECDGEQPDWVCISDGDASLHSISDYIRIPSREVPYTSLQVGATPIRSTGLDMPSPLASISEQEIQGSHGNVTNVLQKKRLAKAAEPTDALSACGTSKSANSTFDMKAIEEPTFVKANGQLAKSTSGLARKAMESNEDAPVRSQAKRRTRTGVRIVDEASENTEEPSEPEVSDSPSNRHRTKKGTMTIFSKASQQEPRRGLRNETCLADSEELQEEICKNLHRKHNVPQKEVKDKLQDFLNFDINGNGSLDKGEFEYAVRRYLNLQGGGPLPKHLLDWHWFAADKDEGGMVDFEEFLVWTVRTAYTEEALVPNPQERAMRRLAREHHLLLPDVERLKQSFDHFDSDGSGYVDTDEFKHILFKLLKLKNVNDISDKKFQRWWREVDIDQSGTICFEEFLLWYIRNFER